MPLHPRRRLVVLLFLLTCLGKLTAGGTNTTAPTTSTPTDPPRSSTPNTTLATTTTAVLNTTAPHTSNSITTETPNTTAAPRTANTTLLPSSTNTLNTTVPPSTTGVPTTSVPRAPNVTVMANTTLMPGTPVVATTTAPRTNNSTFTSNTTVAPRPTSANTTMPTATSGAPFTPAGNRADTPSATVPRTDKPVPVTRPPCTPNLTVSVGGTYTFTASQVVRVYLGLSDGALCGKTPVATWKVGTLSAKGSAFAASLPVGTYQGTVSVTVATITTPLQAAFTVVVTAPPPTIQVRGGDRQATVGSSMTFVAVATGTSSVSWSCCRLGNVTGVCTPVPCAFTTSMLNTAYVGTLAAGFAVAGKYMVNATSDAKVQASVRVVAVSSTSPYNPVQLQTAASSVVYAGTTVTVVAQASKDSVYVWSASNGFASKGAVVNLKPTAAGLLNVTVTATSKSGVVGTASMNFTVLPLPTGTLTVTSPDTPIVGGVSPVTFVLSQWTGPSTAAFRFGWLLNGRWSALSDDFGPATTQTFTAPLVPTDRNVIFAVQALVGKQRLDPIAAVVAVSAPGNNTGAVAERQAVMAAAAAAKDISTVLRAAQDVVVGSTGLSSDGTTSAATLTAATLASVVTPTMSATQKGAAVEVLSSAFNGSVAVKPDNATQKQLVTCLAAVLVGSNSSAAASTDALDASSRAETMLGLIGSVNPTAMATDVSTRDARQQLARNLALTVAAQLSVGQTSTVQSASVIITAAAVPVSPVQPVAVATPQASISVSLDALASAMKAPASVVGQSGATVAVSATSHTTNPVPTAKAPPGTSIGTSAIVEFDVTASGAVFSALDAPITIRLQAAATKAGAAPSCVYFDAATNTWSTAGVVTTDYNATDNTVGCSTTHLSMFATAQAEPTRSPGSGGGVDKVSIFAAVTGGACVFVIVITVILVRRRQHALPVAGRRGSPVDQRHQNFPMQQRLLSPSDSVSYQPPSPPTIP